MPDWLQQTAEALAPTLFGQIGLPALNLKRREKLSSFGTPSPGDCLVFLSGAANATLISAAMKGLRRAPENTSFGHEQRGLLEADVTRYQFQKDESLKPL